MEAICELWFNNAGKTSTKSKFVKIKFFGCGKLPQINEDLIENSKFALFFTDNLSNLNTKLKNGLLEGRDYEFLNE